jgi:hypothetical protein
VATTALPAPPAEGLGTRVVSKPRPKPTKHRNPELERALAEELVRRVSQHRQAGRAALLVGDLDTAFDELWAARLLEPDLNHIVASARDAMPVDWELETDLVPLARALAAKRHPRTAETWRRLLEDHPARSIQAEAAEWLASDAHHSGDKRYALRALHAASTLGKPTEPQTFHAYYKQAGLDPATAFGLYLTASRIDPRTARAVVLRDPLTDAIWPDQDARWWVRGPLVGTNDSDADHHQAQALGRARDLVLTRRDEGWLLLAEGDFEAGPLGVRSLGRAVRAGCAEPADEDAFVRIRLAYEGAAERLPDSAWPWYRLAELLAWAGFAERTNAHLAEAERRSLGNRDAERTARPLLRELVHAGLGYGPDGMATAARPFPSAPFAPPSRFSLRLFR